MNPQDNTPEALLAASGIDNFEARLLLAHASGLSRVQMLTRSQDPLPAEQADAARALFTRRAQGEPVAYLLGRRDFHALTLAVSPAVLIPRPETELLVELASARIARDAAAKAHALVLQRQHAGLATQLDVLAAQKPLLQLDQQLAALAAKRRTATIALDQALGGGIAVAAPPATASH